jgi:hypothetical protein
MPLKCKLGYGPIEVQNHFNNYYFVKPAVSSAARNLYWSGKIKTFLCLASIILGVDRI